MGTKKELSGNTPGAANILNWIYLPMTKKGVRRVPIPLPSFVWYVSNSHMDQPESANIKQLHLFKITQFTPWPCTIYSNNNVHAEAVYLRAQKKQNVPLRETCSHTTGLHAFKWPFYTSDAKPSHAKAKSTHVSHF